MKRYEHDIFQKKILLSRGEEDTKSDKNRTNDFISTATS